MSINNVNSSGPIQQPGFGASSGVGGVKAAYNAFFSTAAKDLGGVKSINSFNSNDKNAVSANTDKDLGLN